MLFTATDALIVVDYQNDFISGTLPVPGAAALQGRINALVHYGAKAAHAPIAFSRCRHPPNHCSFVEQGGPWPPHCVAWTWGADYPSGLATVPDYARVIHVSKGQLADREEYSAFQANYLSLEQWLLALNVNRVVLVGVATDVCVKDTALDARRAGFETVVIESCVAGLDKTDEAKREMRAAGVLMRGE